MGNEEAADDGLGDNVAMLLAMLASANEVEEVSSGSGGVSGGCTGASPFASFKLEDKTDELNLSGMLNVLDGVVDCPDRIVVMTSNHPEKLDPALIRPGRVNLKLYLGYIELPEATLMVDHYFGGYKDQHLSDAQIYALEVAWTLVERAGVSLTPAQLEQLCAENDQPEQLCAALSRLGTQILGVS